MKENITKHTLTGQKWFLLSSLQSYGWTTTTTTVQSDPRGVMTLAISQPRDDYVSNASLHRRDFMVACSSTERSVFFIQPVTDERSSQVKGTSTVTVPAINPPVAEERQPEPQLVTSSQTSSLDDSMKLARRFKYRLEKIIVRGVLSTFVDKIRKAAFFGKNIFVARGFAYFSVGWGVVGVSSKDEKQKGTSTVTVPAINPPVAEERQPEPQLVTSSQTSSLTDSMKLARRFKYRSKIDAIRDRMHSRPKQNPVPFSRETIFVAKGFAYFSVGWGVVGVSSKNDIQIFVAKGFAYFSVGWGVVGVSSKNDIQKGTSTVTVPAINPPVAEERQPEPQLRDCSKCKANTNMHIVKQNFVYFCKYLCHVAASVSATTLPTASSVSHVSEIDATKKVCTKLAGSDSYSASFSVNVGNELGEILKSVITSSDSSAILLPMAEGWMDRYAAAEVTPSVVLYTNRDCCRQNGPSSYKLLFNWWSDLVIRLDVWHFMRRLAVGCTSESHPLDEELIAARVRDPSDMVVDQAITFAELTRHCRRQTQTPKEIKSLIEDLILNMTAMTDTLGVPVFKEISNIWALEMKHVPCLEDPDFPLIQSPDRVQPEDLVTVAVCPQFCCVSMPVTGQLFPCYTQESWATVLVPAFKEEISNIWALEMKHVPCLEDPDFPLIQSPDRSVVSMLSSRKLGNSPSSLQSTMSELHTEEWLRRYAEYLRECVLYSKGVLAGTAQDYQKEEGFKKIPKSQWFLACYARDMWKRLESLRSTLTSTFESVLKIDATKKVCKKLAGSDSYFASFAVNVGNEWGEILQSVITSSESSATLRPMAEGLMQQGLPHPLSFIQKETAVVRMVCQLKNCYSIGGVTLLSD
eukprot:gene1125-15467_t